MSHLTGIVVKVAFCFAAIASAYAVGHGRAGDNKSPSSDIIEAYANGTEEQKALIQEALKDPAIRFSLEEEKKITHYVKQGPFRIRYNPDYSTYYFEKWNASEKKWIPRVSEMLELYGESPSYVTTYCYDDDEKNSIRLYVERDQNTQKFRSLILSYNDRVYGDDNGDGVFDRIPQSE